MIVARYNKNSSSEKKEKLFDQWHFHANSWNHSILPGALPLYGFNPLSYEHTFVAFLITGREKCAAALHQLGLAAVTNCLGESFVNKSDFSSLRIFNRFIILRDNDSVGIKFAQKTVSQLLKGAENAEIFVCNLKPDIPKGDGIDWMQGYPLRGRFWDGFKLLSNVEITFAKTSLCQEIENTKVLVQKCPEVKFKAEHLLFDGEPLPLEEQILSVPSFSSRLFSKTLC